VDASELRALQAPIKHRYREDPGVARVTNVAEGRFEGTGLTCTVSTWSGEVVAGLHPATGGDGDEACSADMLLQALVACAGVTLRSVATAMGVALRGAVVRAEGSWDARGTLGVDREAPVGLTDIALSFTLETDEDPGTIEKLVDLTERYCVIYQTLRSRPRLTTQVARVTRSEGD
jgi:uncharacterized OsmC-like protein